jgi:2-keto-3-deoxy-L-rhamnonate aldolase RhmA
MANNVKKIWASGKVVINGWLAIPSGFSAEVMAKCGFDSLTVDLQHGVQDYQSMIQCFQAMQAQPVTPMVRVPWNEPSIIGKALDGGAYGVICPMINTKKEAEDFMSYCKYPPLGIRSNGPIRAGMYGDAGSYQTTANDETLCIPMIETRKAVENLESILDVPGIAGVYIGPPISASPMVSCRSLTGRSRKFWESTTGLSRNATSVAFFPVSTVAVLPVQPLPFNADSSLSRSRMIVGCWQWRPKAISRRPEKIRTVSPDLTFRAEFSRLQYRE